MYENQLTEMHNPDMNTIKPYKSDKKHIKLTSNM